MLNGFVPLDEWAAVLRHEYLRDYVRDGGAAVKFVVPCQGLAGDILREEIRSAATEEGYFYAFVDGGETKLHMVDRIFHAVARQVDWTGTACAFLQNMLAEASFRLPQGGETLDLETIAALNEFDLREMRVVVNQRLRDSLFRDYDMTQDFRLAMTSLCRAQLDIRDVPEGLTEGILEWLKGELRLVSALKPAAIFQKIGRNSGRHMLYSLARWMHRVRGSGMVLVLDMARFLEDKKSQDGTLYYTPAAVMEGYEVLRQFIDSTDEMSHGMVIVVAPERFLHPDEVRRGIWAYEALQLRIQADVKDKLKANPLSSLVRVSRLNHDAAAASPGGVPCEM